MQMKSKWVGKGSRNLFLKFCEPHHRPISGTVEARKFGVEIDLNRLKNSLKQSDRTLRDAFEM